MQRVYVGKDDFYWKRDNIKMGDIIELWIIIIQPKRVYKEQEDGIKDHWEH